MSQPDKRQQQEPVSPLTGLVESAIAVHEMFCSYIEAGFTERQALILLAEIIAAQGRATS